ncbi:hypothetical protein ASE69_16525 [Sphingomonas sp. Leaf208]|uniref:hypothetical protein n=1 Tax=Sphingomonas sp. Leaf208 TaxID=1735679 RepID=UPI0006FDC950|nr:hypothetical protein [Sphingomonas sp. Leaf208]KQM46301.1 hypothetical protein ASE69_16525 [Sphingomonas sp. Leaf208]
MRIEAHAAKDTKTALAVVAASLDTIAPTPREPRRRKTNRERLPARLQRIEQVVDIENKACGCRGGALYVIGEDVGVRGRGAPVTYLFRMASIHSNERIAPSNRGISSSAEDRREKLAILRNAFAPNGPVRATAKQHKVGSGAFAI